MKLTDLRGILRYIPQFRDKTFIINVDGAIVTDENFTNLLVDIAVLRSLNIHVVLVHGASAQIRALARETGRAPSNLDGTGITDEATLQLALTAANRLTHEILEGLAANDLRAACTNAVIAHPAGILHGVDQLFTGKVERVDTELLQRLLAQGIIPILPPLGFDGEGKTYRVNSDGVALAAAEALKAAKLMFITAHDGIRVGERIIRQMPLADLESVLTLQRQAIPPDLLSKAIHAAAACKAGVPRVHVINGSLPEGLLAEVFTNEGVGTLIYGNEFQQIRRALKKDIRSILNLTRGSVESEELVKRTRPAIEKQLADYYIFEIDKNPVACVALHTWPELGKGELACLYVSSAHENQGIGRKLVQFVENKARELGLQELIALSTQAFTWFQSKGGFAEGTPDDLPPARREKYDQSGRHSKILLKKLK
ncbi:MAG TPA: amino-acid N-acetyltransferase [Verrucomicrobiota bacterium]|nr:amino-acid N-acetyltransferase [Verrucomicrobiota bacterium]OQC27059.1 MAG: Amino-acid acetyltransferase [Verrucomicrobia bacterium ADurb.Bin063]HRR64428.1 amino-acid N-acetyltransferase [Candidatus Paceibacterota bacterium]NLH85398.1 amino-acid N-acetyltransferase [Verrucomicrobiota bacterium]HNR71526.1 amino-acid N-acetyltransferase [Verrucomicrobiota bacterium]